MLIHPVLQLDILYSITFFIKQLSYYVRSHWSISVFRLEYVNTVVTFQIHACFKNYFINAIEHFFHVYIIFSKHSEGWENSGKLYKPLTTSRVCITLSNSPNPPCVKMRLCKQEKVLYCLIILRTKKNKLK